MKKIIGVCIYCESRSNLSDEHVIPLGLLPKGQEEFVLEKASCPDCKDKTSMFERGVLRHLLRMARSSLKMKSYRKHPDRFFIMANGENIEIPVEELGAPILLPIFAQPSVNKIGIDVVGSHLIWHGEEKLMKLIKDKGEIGVKYNFRPTDFAKMIAKIAYGYAVYQYGVDRFSEVFILPSILGTKDDIGSWVGCIDKKVTNSNYISLEIGINNKQILVLVRFFEKWNGPTYAVIVGRVF